MKAWVWLHVAPIAQFFNFFNDSWTSNLNLSTLFFMWWIHTLEVHFPVQICSEIEHVTVTSGEQPVYYSNLHHHLQCIRYSMAV